MFSCGGKDKRLSHADGEIGEKAVPESSSGNEAGKNVPKHAATVTTQVLLTGLAARVEAFPATVQDESSLAANGILPWGPVQAIHTVTISTQQWVVNELTSPDPFTHTYQLPDGTIFVSNDPLEDIVTFSGVEGPEPDRVQWTSDYGDIWEVLPGRMDVYFDQSATEADIQQLIQQNDLSVVMSWFEGPDESGMQSLTGGGGDGDPKETSGAARHASTGTIGNEIAWFDFEYDQTRFTTVDAAYAWFKSLPQIMTCCPHITDYGEGEYSDPEDPLYTTTFSSPSAAKPSLWIDAFDLNNFSGIPLEPSGYSGKKQVIAVIDSGVYRSHEDPSRLTSIGVNTYDHSYEVKNSGGQPNYRMDQPRWAQGQPDFHPDYLSYFGHGTQVASLINSRTDNGFGLPSLAPSATILPIRMKFWTRFHGLPGVLKDRPTFSINAHVKAIRALRFQFAHGQYDFYVRVVNLSWAYPKWARQIPWPWNGFDEGFKTNLDRDLNKNDRLYVAAAGNSGAEARWYPAAHSNVMGVTGYTFDPDASDQYSRHPDSNWSPTMGVYEVSGIYDITPVDVDINNDGFIDGEIVPTFTATTKQYDYSYALSTRYYYFSGTSAATPQIAALAYHLYSRKPALTGPNSTNYSSVMHQIVSYRMPGQDTPGMMNAPADFRLAINNW